MKKACIISNTPEPLKTHHQLNVGKLGNFNASRVATEDYLRRRRIFKTTSAGNTHTMKIQWKSMPSPENRKGKKSGKGKKGGKKGKDGQGTGKSKSKVTEICESDSSKQVDDWNPSSNTSAQQPNLSQVNTIGCADEGL